MPKAKNLTSYSYSRKTIFQDRECELLLITWPGDSKSHLHDHGKSHGLIRVLKGRIFQDEYASKTLKFLGRTIHKKGDIIREVPGTLHVMGNVSKTSEAETLHFYTPSLKMRVYEVNK